MSKQLNPKLFLKLKSLTKQEIRVGTKIKCVNPNHTDKVPSMFIYPDRAVCFGCGYVVTPTAKKKINKFELICGEFFKLASKQSTEEWAKQRGYDNQILNRLGIGFCNDEVYEALLELFGKGVLSKYGWIKNKKYVYANRVIIPFSKNYFSARSTSRDTRHKNLFPPKQEKEPYIINPNQNKVVVVEGETSAIAAHHILPDTTIISTGGTGSAKKVIRNLEDYTDSNSIYLCFDNDEAGEKCLKETLPILVRKGYKIKQVSFPKKYKDIDDLHFDKRNNSEKYITYLELEEMMDNSVKPLKDPHLVENLLREVKKKVEGEELTILTLILTGSGIWVENRKGMINNFISAQSSTGKDYITKAVFDLFPESNKVHRTRISGRAFTYWHQDEPGWTWDGKLCYLSDIGSDVLNSEVFKTMCSEGSKSTIVKDQKTIDIDIKGKPLFWVTTATGTPTNEILNRFVTIKLDETDDQTRAIIERQLREAAQGNSPEYDPELLNSLCYLKRIKIRIPFAERLNILTARYIRMRRYNKTFLELIKCSTALHQYQRKKDEDGFYLAEGFDYMFARKCLNKIQIETPPLTHDQQKFHQCCLDYAEEHLVDSDEFSPEKQAWFTAKEIHTYALPKVPVSIQMVYDYLKLLVGHGLLKARTEKREESKRMVTTYHPVRVNEIDLPTFEQLFDKTDFDETTKGENN